MKKKILLIIDSLGPGGAQNQITLLAVQLKSKYDVSVLTYHHHTQPFFSKRLSDYEINHFQIEKKDFIGLTVIIPMCKLILQQRFDVIISFLETPNFYAAVIKFLLKDKIKLIVSYRSSTNFSKISFLRLKILEWTNLQADFIVSNSIHECNLWKNRYINLSYKWKTIYNAIEEKHIDRKPVSDIKNKLLVVGSVGADKNGLLIIEALKILRNKKKDCQITWIGQRVKHLKDRMQYLLKMEAKIKEYNLNAFWNWIDPVTDLNSYYLTHKALILASEVEGLPNVVCEAMSLGVPCIVSNVLDHPILIENGKNGFVFNSKSAVDLANAIEKLLVLTDNDILEIQKNNIRKSKYFFDIKIFKDEYERLIEYEADTW